MKRRAAGFTMVELLIIMAIIAIVAGIFAWNMLRTLRQNELRDAAYQLMTDVRKTRATVQKTGLPSMIEIQPDKVTYNMQTGTGPISSRILPNGVQVVPNTPGAYTQMMYFPPFGTLGADGTVWKLSSPSFGLITYVKIVGVTGKVMLSAAP